MKNSMEIKIKADLKNVSTIRLAVSAFISNLNVTVDEMVDIKTAVSEAVTNAIEHGYEEYSDDNVVLINVNLKNGEDEIVEIIVTDFGIGIEDVSLAMTPEYTTKPEEEHAGMGFTIMESFMDEVLVDSSKTNGTKIKLVKKLKRKHS